MTVISILDRLETKGTVYVTIGDELMAKNAAEDFAISKNEWKKLTLQFPLAVGMTVNEEIYVSVSSAAERTKAVRLGATIVSGSDKSASAVLRKLRDKGISKESAEHAVALLIRRGYIDEDGAYVLEGKQLSKIFNSTNFNDSGSMRYLYNYIVKQGGIRLLQDLGLKEGDTVRIEDFEFEYTED